MKLITLSELQYTTGLSDQALLNLLKDNSIAMEYNKSKGILVDIDKVQTRNLVEIHLKKQLSSLEQNKDLIKEKLAVIIATKLEDLICEVAKDLNDATL